MARKTKEEKAKEREAKTQAKINKNIEDLTKKRNEALSNYQKEQAKGEDTDTMALQKHKDDIEYYDEQLRRLGIYKEETPEQRKLTLSDVKETFKDIPSALGATAKAYASNFAPMTEEDKKLYEEQKKQYAETYGAAPAEEVTETTETVAPSTTEAPVETPTTTPVETMATPEEDITQPTPQKETTPFNWRENTDKLGLYANALLDSIGASHKRKANQAVALSGFAGPYGSTQKLYSEEETQDPFSKMRQQTYENYLSSQKNIQAALNDVTRTDIKNKYKSVYDIDAANTTERQAYITQTLGNIQNKLNIDLNRSIMSMKKEELQAFVSELEENLDEISENIADEGIINGLKQSIPLLMKASLEGNLESALLNANVNAVGNAATTLGGGLASLIGTFIK